MKDKNVSTHNGIEHLYLRKYQQKRRKILGGCHVFLLPLHTKKNKKMTREHLIDKHQNLFWYTPAEKRHQISDDLLVETVLNEGTLDDYRELMQTLDAHRVAEVFFSAKGRKKANYYPEIYRTLTRVALNGL